MRNVYCRRSLRGEVSAGISSITIVASIVIALFMSAVGLVGCGKADGDERQVVVYCSVDQEVAEPIIAAFEASTGIKVLARFDTESSKTVGLVQRLRAQKDSPTADVFWSSEIFHTIRLGHDGLLAKYESDDVKDWPKGLADPQGRWYAFAMRARVIAYNTKRVGAKEAPKRLEDLLDAKWKGRIVMARPEFGTTGGDVASWFAHYGRTRAEEILKALKANGVRLVDSNSTAVRMVASGQADICMTDTDDVHAGVRNGWPIAMNMLDQNGAGTLAIPNTAALIAGGPNSAEAREFMAFVLGEQVEKMLAESDSHNMPVRKSLASKYQQYAVVKRLDVPYEKIAGELSRAIRTAGRILD